VIVREDSLGRGSETTGYASRLMIWLLQVQSAADALSLSEQLKLVPANDDDAVKLGR